MQGCMVSRRLTECFLFLFCTCIWFSTILWIVQASIDTTTSSESTICRIALNHILRDPTVPTNGTKSDVFYACQPVTKQDDDTYKLLSKMYIMDDNLFPSAVKIEIDQRASYSDLYVIVRNILLDDLTATVVPTIDNDHIFFEVVDMPSSLNEVSRHRLRRLVRQTKTLNVMMVRIVALDSEPTNTIEELFDLTFSTTSPTSAQSQMLACSAGQLYLKPAMSVGVINVPVNLYANDLKNGPTSSDSVRYVLLNAAYEAVPKVLREIAESKASSSGGYSGISRDPTSISDIRDIADLFMMVVPPAQDDSNWAAFGTVDGSASVYNDVWASFLGATMHEIGHNLGFYHSNVDGNEYQDTTGYMGSEPSIQNFPRKCYNAQNHDQVQWFRDKTLKLSTWQPDMPRLIKVAAFVDYSKVVDIHDEEYYVVVVVNDEYYIQYNRAKLHNIEASLPDKLIIVRNYYKSTDRVAALDVNGTYDMITNDGSNLYIAICSKRKTDGYYENQKVDYMLISVGYSQQDTKKLCAMPEEKPTPTPTVKYTTLPKPTVNPTPSDVYTKYPKDDKPATLPPLEPTSSPNFPTADSTLSPTHIIHDGGDGTHNGTDGFVDRSIEHEAKQQNRMISYIVIGFLIICTSFALFYCYRRRSRKSKLLPPIFTISEKEPNQGFFRSRGNNFVDYDVKYVHEKKINDEGVTDTSSDSSCSERINLATEAFDAAADMLNMLCSPEIPTNEPAEPPSSSPELSSWASFLIDAFSEIFNSQLPQQQQQQPSQHQNTTVKNETEQQAQASSEIRPYLQNQEQHHRGLEKNLVAHYHMKLADSPPLPPPPPPPQPSSELPASTVTSASHQLSYVVASNEIQNHKSSQRQLLWLPQAHDQQGTQTEIGMSQDANLDAIDVVRTLHHHTADVTGMQNAELSANDWHNSMKKSTKQDALHYFR